MNIQDSAGSGQPEKASPHMHIGRVTGAQIGDNNIQNNYFGRQVRSAVTAVVTPVPSADEASSNMFVGRDDEVATLLDMLDPTKSSVGSLVISAVAGLAGIGKTALARQAASLAAQRGWFTGGTVMVDLHGYDQGHRVEPVQVFAPVLRGLGFDSTQIPPDPDEQGTAYHQVLTVMAEEGRSVLLVFDNASSPLQVIDLIPAHRTHRVLITSRHTFGDLDGARVLELGVLGTDTSVALLDRSLRQRHPNDQRAVEQLEEARALAQLCGGLPLALQIVAALLADERNRSLVDLVVELVDAKTRLDGLSYGERAVRAAFDLSWQHLADHDQSAARLFRLLSINPGPDFAVGAASAISDQRPVTTLRQLRTLRRAHLIEPGVSSERWRMHDLVSLYSISLEEQYAQTDDPKAAQQRLVSYYVETAQVAGSWINSRPSDEALILFPDRASGFQWLSLEQVNLINAVRLAHTIGEHDDAIDLSCAIVPYLESRRYLADSLSASEIALESARVLGVAIQEAGVLNNIGVALTSMRRYKEAIRFLNKAVAKARQSRDIIEESTALTSLAGALRQRYGPHMGVGELQRAIQISLSAGDSRGAAFAMTNLGIAFREAGQFDRAEGILHSALQIHIKTGARRGEASTLIQLATTLGQMGKSNECVPIFRRAIDAYRDVGDKHGEAQAVMNFANQLRQSGDIEDALELYFVALRVFQDTDDPHASALAQANVGFALRQLGRTDEAEDYLTAARIALSALGDARTLTDLDSEAI